MSQRALITGGAGFIGSHLADQLLAHGYTVRCLDNLDPQVHGESRAWPAYLSPEVELMRGSVCDAATVKQALRDVDLVFHLAACVGVGQSMYELTRYTQVNNIGTATLLEALIAQPVERLVVASSMSIYGEGLYRDATGGHCESASRSLGQLRAQRWEPEDEQGRPLKPIATPETKRPDLASMYALNKYDQERMCLIIGQAYGIPTVALRFFNVYGPRQALSNPYTGVLAIFASRLLNGNAPLIFEDGNQCRDFVSVHDVARACRLAMETPDAAGQVFNIGSGRSYTVREIADRVADALNTPIEPEITGKYRVGDIRHCFPDTSRAERVLGYRPRVALEAGLEELAGWLEGQAPDDRVGQASAELAARGLTV